MRVMLLDYVIKLILLIFVLQQQTQLLFDLGNNTQSIYKFQVAECRTIFCLYVESCNFLLQLLASSWRFPVFIPQEGKNKCI